MSTPTSLPSRSRCDGCGASLAVSWDENSVCPGYYVGAGFCCKCNMLRMGLFGPDRRVRRALLADFQRAFEGSVFWERA